MKAWKLGLFAINAALVMLATVPPSAAGDDKIVRRKIVALYHSATTPNLRHSPLHQYAQMPLNHLGLVVVYHDLSKGLPDAKVMAGARGVVTWFTDRVAIAPVPYMNWLHRQMDAGRRLVMLGHPGFVPSRKASATTQELFRRLMARIGVRWLGKHHKLTYNARVVHSDRRFMNFERPLPSVFPEFDGVQAASDASVVLLSIAINDIRNDVIVVGPEGGYVNVDFAILEDYQVSPALKAWYLNPFRYFRLAFATQGVPKPDITTMSGRRLYYSHIDGDGWRNLAQQAELRKDGLNAAEVIYREILMRYVDLPVTLGPVIGDLDPKWYGSEKNLGLARRIFRLPHVEAGHHTHSHPFEWSFFRNYKPEKEKAYSRRYPVRPGRTRAESVFNDKSDERRSPQPRNNGSDLAKGPPRAYAVQPFSLKLEVFDSTEFIKRLLPSGKRVRLYQWSGDTSPFRAALAATARAGLRNINGGDGRMDRIYRSYAFVAPYGRWVGGLWQPYTSHANENIYTPNWKAQHFAFVRLIESLRNTGRPLRVTPVNVYYHLFIAERTEGLASLKRVLDYVSQLEIAPVAASRFAAMSDGFVKTRFVPLGLRRWQIEDRDGIETVRFDYASADCVDFARSHGLVGQRHHQGSLYVALDRAVARPIVALATCNAFSADPPADLAYLIHARWRTWALEQVDPKQFRFRGFGFGPGRFVWHVRQPGAYRVRGLVKGQVVHDKVVSVGDDRRLIFTLPRSADPIGVAVQEVGK